MKNRSSFDNPARTAVIVIHGIGEQVPYETLDAFATTFVKCLHNVELSHEIITRKDGNGIEWQESFVQIDHEDGPPIDVHEYYWAYLTEGQISIPEVLSWVQQTLEATKKFYQSDVELQKKYEERRGTKKFPLLYVLWLLRAAALVLPFLKLAWLIASPFSHKPLDRWLHALLDRFGWIITGYIGDVAIYTTTDEKSKYYRIRQEILKECQALVEEILNDKHYDRVIIAGHSLGSVIAYDTLNRINIETNLNGKNSIPIKKLSGLITFGSPLDKVAFFFREHTRSDQYIRRQILAHLHSFKSKPLDFQKEDHIVRDPLARNLDFIPWVNYYARKDPVSGHLDFYDIKSCDNVELALPQPWGAAHCGYWTSLQFYDDIVTRFIKSYNS